MTETPMTADAISAMTPAQATEALVAKAAAYHAPRGPSPPAGSAVAARATLEGLSANPEWRDKYFGGDVEARRQFEELTERIANCNPTAETLAGVRPGEFEVTVGNELNSRKRADAVAGLRSLGFDDATVVQAIDGAEVGPHELAMAKQMKAMRLSDAAWIDRYMKGDLSARREMSLLNTILSSEAA
jgi:hypothetical protein